MFKKAAYTPYVTEYKERIKEIQDKFTEGENFIKASNPNCWANSLFAGKRWGIIDNNIAESWNSWVRVARTMPIVGLMDEIRRKIMIMMNGKRNEATKRVGRLCPKPEKRLKFNIYESRKLEVDTSCGWKFEVSDEGNKFAVDLTNKTCSCRYFQLESLPCRHACASILSLGLSPYDFCDNYYSLEKYREAYILNINPIPSNLIVEESLPEDVVPPDVQRPSGRPRSKRIPSQIEETRQIKCGRCKKFGHNRRTCKEPI